MFHGKQSPMTRLYVQLGKLGAWLVQKYGPPPVIEPGAIVLKDVTIRAPRFGSTAAAEVGCTCGPNPFKLGCLYPKSFCKVHRLWPNDTRPVYVRMEGIEIERVQINQWAEIAESGELKCGASLPIPK